MTDCYVYVIYEPSWLRPF